MPWNVVTVKEQRQNFIRDYRLGYYTISDLAESFGISLEFPRFRGHPLMTLRPDFSGVSMYHPPRENAATAILERVFSALCTSCTRQLAFRSLASSNSAGE